MAWALVIPGTFHRRNTIVLSVASFPQSMFYYKVAVFVTIFTEPMDIVCKVSELYEQMS